MIHAFQTGQWRRWVVVAGTACLMFIGWELLILWRYGDSHFWLGFGYFRPSTSGKLKLIQPLAGYLGSTMAAAIPLCLAALGHSRRVVWGSAGLVLASFALVAFPHPAFAALGDALQLRGGPTFGSVTFGILGLTLIGCVAMSGSRLLRDPRGAAGLAARHWLYSIDGFLVLWLMLEVTGYFVLSPYPAARRIIGIVVPALLLTFRLAARRPAAECYQVGTIGGTVGVSLLLGLLSFAVDFNGYHGEKTAALELASACHQKSPAAKIWIFGNGAFEFYGKPFGMSRLVAHQLIDPQVAPGDWVLVVRGFEQDHARHPIASRCVPEEVRDWNSVLPLRSQYQVGAVALAHRDDSLVCVTVFRAW